MSEDGEVERSPLEEALSQVALWEALTRTEAWAILSEFIAQQVKHRTDLIMTTPRTNQEKIIEEEFNKGEANGLRMVETFVNQSLAEAKDAVELIRESNRMVARG